MNDILAFRQRLDELAANMQPLAFTGDIHDQNISIAGRDLMLRLYAIGIDQNG